MFLYTLKPLLYNRQYRIYHQSFRMLYLHYLMTSDVKSHEYVLSFSANDVTEKAENIDIHIANVVIRLITFLHFIVILLSHNYFFIN